MKIEIHPEDRDSLRFLWIDDIHSEEPDILTQRFNPVVLGVNSLPLILNAVLKHHIETYKDFDSQFVSKLAQGFYVDDLVTGCKSAKEAIYLFNTGEEQMLEGGFKLRKWKTNDGLENIRMWIENAEVKRQKVEDSIK